MISNNSGSWRHGTVSEQINFCCKPYFCSDVSVTEIYLSILSSMPNHIIVFGLNLSITYDAVY
jgi:hypothetical protein